MCVSTGFDREEKGLEGRDCGECFLVDFVEGRYVWSVFYLCVMRILR